MCTFEISPCFKQITGWPAEITLELGEFIHGLGNLGPTSKYICWILSDIVLLVLGNKRESAGLHVQLYCMLCYTFTSGLAV